MTNFSVTNEVKIVFDVCYHSAALTKTVKNGKWERSLPALNEEVD